MEKNTFMRARKKNNPMEKFEFFYKIDFHPTDKTHNKFHQIGALVGVGSL
jgi:hypothetical protein